MTINKCSQLGFSQSAYFLSSDSAVLKEDQSRNAANIELGRNALVLVNVHLCDLDLVAVLTSEFFKDGADHLAWAAPLRPEVEQYRFIGLENILLE